MKIETETLEWTEFFADEKPVKMNDLVEIISEVFSVPSDKVLTKSRKRELVIARFCYMYILKRVFMFSSKYIYRITGWDHSSVFNACDKMQIWLDTDMYVQHNHERVLSRLKKSMVRLPIDPKYSIQGDILIYKLNTIINSKRLCDLKNL